MSAPTQQTIVSLPLKKLHPHPANPNRISQARFNSLVRHIETTGQYEPLTVRAHPSKAGAWQILNGHHRLRALKHLHRTHADCVVFTADDHSAELYLLSLNRLGGRDNLYKKAKLIERLCQTRSSRELARWLPDSKTAIEKLNALSKNQPLPKAGTSAPALKPMTFFLTDAQHTLLGRAFEKAGHNETPAARTGRRIGALMQIVQDYLEIDRPEETPGSEG
jgi:hypothetical protein